ncbi:MAG: hypothetical protein AAF282_05555 [Cyanobacteria bacterium P01_A01_bin.15]
MHQNPITYYVQTPAIEILCKNYGSYLENMAHLEKLKIAAALSQAVFRAEADVLDALLENSSVAYLATCDGFNFENHNSIVQLLRQLDNELNSPMAAELVTGIYSNLDFTQD